jgi:hypothetical protein
MRIADYGLRYYDVGDIVFDSLARRLHHGSCHHESFVMGFRICFINLGYETASANATFRRYPVLFI